MKKEGLLLAAILLLASISASAETRMGLRITFGGNYDNVRFSPGTLPGTKGGPFADISFIYSTTKYEISVPLARPILYALSFGILHFEPGFLVFPGHDKPLHAGFGGKLVIYNGPDFNADINSTNTGHWVFGPGITGSMINDFNGDPLGGTHSFSLAADASVLFSPEYGTGFSAGPSFNYSILW